MNRQELSARTIHKYLTDIMQWLEQVEKVDTEPRRKGRWMDALLSDLPRGMVL